MSVLETGNIYWQEFVYRGQRIQESTQQTWRADFLLGTREIRLLPALMRCRKTVP